MRIKMRKAAAAMAAAGLLMLAAPAQSATDGNLGATSSGTAGVSVVVPQMVRITGLADLAINPYAGPTSAASGNVCVYSNTGNYQITATTVETAFSMIGQTDATQSITYAVEWAATSGAGTGTALTYNTALGAQSSGGANLACANVGGTNSTLIVRVTDTDIGVATAQTYAGTLNLVVAPN
jgi:hypothetical protein